MADQTQNPQMENEREKQTQASGGVSRRVMFNILGSVPMVAAAAAPAANETMHAHMHDAMQAAASTNKAPFKRQTFDDHQWKTVHVLCDLIIPADERSGSASSAGVPEFMDDWIAFRNQEEGNSRIEAEIFGCLAWLDRESGRLFSADFADASPAQQKQILDRIAYNERIAPEDKLWAQAFSEFRNLTVSGFFSSKAGVADLPYLGNTVVVEWKGCDPKVWSVIEQRMENGYEGLIKVKRA